MPEINLYFPTPIYIETDLFDAKQNQIWNERLYKLQETVESGGKGWEGNTYTTHAEFDLRTDEVFSPLLESVAEHVKNFTHAHKSNYQHECASAWGNINPQGTWQEYHAHPSSVFSAVYYPKVPEGSGSIVFENPLVPDMMPVQHIEERDDMTFERISYQPKEGMLVIFRSYIQHCVRQGTNTEDRISIALNYA